MGKRIKRSFLVTEPKGTRAITTYGQTARCLDALIEAGDTGTTSLEISTWALRTSSYISQLRHKHGLSIKTSNEDHTNPDGFVGTHARYRLQTLVVETTEVMEAAE